MRATQLTADNSRRAGELELERIRREHEENQVKEVVAENGWMLSTCIETVSKVKWLDSERSGASWQHRSLIQSGPIPKGLQKAYFYRHIAERNRLA